jgi:hypothetical protein
MGAYELTNCPADLTGDGLIGPADLANLLAHWGPCSSSPIPTGCPGDLDCDHAVGPADLAALLAAWGECPGAGGGESNSSQQSSPEDTALRTPS